MQNRVRYPEADYINCQRCPLHESRRRIVLRGYGRVSNGTVEREGRLLYYNRELQEGNEEGILPARRSFFCPTLLFIGEAPGQTENILGIPFIGEAGRILNLCLSYCTTSFDIELTNILACRPWTTSKYGNIINRTPSQEEIQQCLPRVKSLINHLPYDGVVALGEVPKKNLPTLYPSSSFPYPKEEIEPLYLLHPSAILRMEYKLYEIKQFALKLDTYVKNICQSRFRSEDGE